MARRSVAPRTEVPFLHEKQIEDEANVLIAEYGEHYEPIVSPPVPVDEMAEIHLRVTLEYRDMKSLFPFADVHGAIWFSEAKIGIDQILDPQTNPSRLGRYHFTLAHEVGHWRLHRQHYLKNPAERRLFDDFRAVVARHDAGLADIRFSAIYGCRPLGGVTSPETDAADSEPTVAGR